MLLCNLWVMVCFFFLCIVFRWLVSLCSSVVCLMIVFFSWFLCLCNLFLVCLCLVMLVLMLIIFCMLLFLLNYGILVVWKVIMFLGRWSVCFSFLGLFEVMMWWLLWLMVLVFFLIRNSLWFEWYMVFFQVLFSLCSVVGLVKIIRFWWFLMKIGLLVFLLIVLSNVLVLVSFWVLCVCLLYLLLSWLVEFQKMKSMIMLLISVRVGSISFGRIQLCVMFQFSSRLKVSSRNRVCGSRWCSIWLLGVMCRIIVMSGCEGCVISKVVFSSVNISDDSKEMGSGKLRQMNWFMLYRQFISGMVDSVMSVKVRYFVGQYLFSRCQLCSSKVSVISMKFIDSKGGMVSGEIGCVLFSGNQFSEYMIFCISEVIFSINSNIVRLMVSLCIDGWCVLECMQCRQSVEVFRMKLFVVIFCIVSRFESKW